MSGKAYSIKEMKNIVDYLVEHKAYGEIKGRKMWKDLADSKITTRTWQSLKETFLKRILPDIHNPYYKLSLHQISSFQRGYDVEERLNNKLEIRPATHDSNTESEEKPNASPDNNEDKNEGKPAGEDNKQSESDLRASTETLVLEDCYENVEEKDESPKKSLRELITYSEPLTPMLQAVIDDFATDDGEGSNDEPRMQIVEVPDTDLNHDEENKEKTNGPAEKSNKSEKSQERAIKETTDTTNSKAALEKSESNQLNTIEKKSVNEKEDNVSIVLSDTDEVTINNKEDSVDVKKPQTSIEMTQNTNSTTDSLLPDNQEAYKGNSQSQTNTIDCNKQLVKNSGNEKRAKKRANSQETKPSTIMTKRFNKEKQSTSDTEAFVKNIKNLPNGSSNTTFKQKTPKAAEKPNTDSIVEEVVENSASEKEEENEKNDNLEINEKISVEVENPCLQSVSLYAEQFSNSKYTDSEASNIEEDQNNKEQSKKEETQPQASLKAKENADIVKKQVTVKAKTDAAKEVVILKSHSESASDSVKEKEIKAPERRQQREKALANMFGFSSGGIRKHRKSSNTYRKRTSSRNQALNISSDSSEWTSDTGSEYVSPPRGRKNRHTRKYLKPKSARVLSLEEEGGLFVMYGKKIYPVVKDGKIIKNYVTYTPDNEFDQEESFWKLKYVEEKKRTAELTKLLNQVKDQEIPSRVPVLPTTSRYESSDDRPKKSIGLVSETKMQTRNSIEGKQEDETTQEGKTVKIKFTKNNEEVQLEGHWSHVNPVLAQVIQLLQKEPELTAKEIKSKQPTPDPQVISGQQTPVLTMVVDEEVHAKVNQLENEIFKEIEEREKSKSPTPKKEMPQTGINVTKRRGRPRKSVEGSAKTTSPAKKPKLDESDRKSTDVDASSPPQTVATRRTTRTPKKNTDKADKADNNLIKTRQAGKKSLPAKDSQEDVKYKFPSPPSTRKSITNKSNINTKNTRQRKSSSLVNVKVHSSPENLSLHSVESTQGYIDSDESPIKTYMRRKKRMSFTLPSYRTRSQIRLRKKYRPYFIDDVTSDSSNSFPGPPLKTMTFQNSTLKSDEYKSESYQLLMNKNVTIRNKSSSRLEKIDEASPLSIDLQYINDQICKDLSDIKTERQMPEKENFTTDSSSNVTLPTSPVLSIVENISINKSLLNHSSDFPFQDELPKNSLEEHITLNEFMKRENDVSMPLMEQECIETGIQNGAEYHYNLKIPKTCAAVSDSLLRKIDIVNIEDPTLSESIQVKLRDLILDSTKKNNKRRSNPLVEKNPTNIDNAEELVDKVTKSKKRSSTPRKRQSTRKSKVTNAEPCIEEEHMETCSHASRQSCPPMIQLFEAFKKTDENKNSIQIPEAKNEKPRGRKKKDVIKVKILKAKPKKLNKEHFDKNIRDSQRSIQTDSGINDIESSLFLNTLNDSVDLIHNHTETCLNTNECLGDSVEIIQNSTKSIISLDSTSNNSDEDMSKNIFGTLPHKISHELFSNDAQDVSVLQKVVGVPEYRSAQSASTSVFHTPLGSLSPPNSLITEDLSDDIVDKPAQNTKWYLFSEDEFSNTNTVDVNQNSLAPIGFGSNLNDIFPVTCAIPDLSTITEMSKENEDNTKKFSDDTNTRNCLDSQSIFND